MTGGAAVRSRPGDPVLEPELLFLSGDPAVAQQLRQVTDRVLDAVVGWASTPGPRSAIEPHALAGLIASIDPCPDDGVGFDDVLGEVAEKVLAYGVRTFDPRCAAHLHSPTLLTAAATELAIGATNQSMDSYDQAPAATLVEDHLVRWLAGIVGLPPGATGVLTAGGTASNLLGLLLARDHAALTEPSGAGSSAVAEAGLPLEAARWRIVASEAAHFSLQLAAAVLGLGHRAVVGVATDDHDRVDLAALDATLARLDGQGLRTIALVGTAGTTDLGAVDPLAGLAERAAARRAWFHVDAAVGAAFCLSDRLRPLVAGLEQADSVTADLHKLWWQPIGASALLVRDPSRLVSLRHPSDYLDRPEDDDTGVLNLVSRSLDTSRRFDALKVLVSLRSTGRRRLAAMVEHLVESAAAAAAAVDRHPDLELLAPPSTITVLFRWRPGDRDLDPAVLDQANTAVQRALFDSGLAVVGRTRHRGRVALKLTLVNPHVQATDLADLLALIAEQGACSFFEPAGPQSARSGSRNVRTAVVEVAP
jgi:L-2,4-diaminobutyrate decarboxylase